VHSSLILIHARWSREAHPTAPARTPFPIDLSPDETPALKSLGFLVEKKLSNESSGSASVPFEGCCDAREELAPSDLSMLVSDYKYEDFTRAGLYDA
jgi:hypothetical protein